jgi:hypothetical protein
MTMNIPPNMRRVGNAHISCSKCLVCGRKWLTYQGYRDTQTGLACALYTCLNSSCRHQSWAEPGLVPIFTPLGN